MIVCAISFNLLITFPAPNRFEGGQLLQITHFAVHIKNKLFCWCRVILGVFGSQLGRSTPFKFFYHAKFFIETLIFETLIFFGYSFEFYILEIRGVQKKKFALIFRKMAADTSRLRHFEAYIVKFLLKMFNNFLQASVIQ